MTLTGKVSCRPSPAQAMWAQLEAAYLDLLKDRSDLNRGICRGLAIAASILTCMTLEEVSAEVHRRVTDG